MASTPFTGEMDEDGRLSPATFERYSTHMNSVEYFETGGKELNEPIPQGYTAGSLPGGHHEDEVEVAYREIQRFSCSQRKTGSENEFIIPTRRQRAGKKWINSLPYLGSTNISKDPTEGEDPLELLLPLLSHVLTVRSGINILVLDPTESLFLRPSVVPNTDRFDLESLSSVSQTSQVQTDIDDQAIVSAPDDIIRTDWIDDFEKEQDPTIYHTNRTVVNSVDLSESETAREEGWAHWGDMTDGVIGARNFISERGDSIY